MALWYKVTRISSSRLSATRYHERAVKLKWQNSPDIKQKTTHKRTISAARIILPNSLCRFDETRTQGKTKRQSNPTLENWINRAFSLMAVDQRFSFPLATREIDRSLERAQLAMSACRCKLGLFVPPGCGGKTWGEVSEQRGERAGVRGGGGGGSAVIEEFQRSGKRSDC